MSYGCGTHQVFVERGAAGVLNDDHTKSFGCREDGGFGVYAFCPDKLDEVSGGNWALM